jgi:hypothetical protein
VDLHALQQLVGLSVGHWGYRKTQGRDQKQKQKFSHLIPPASTVGAG